MQGTFSCRPERWKLGIKKFRTEEVKHSFKLHLCHILSSSSVCWSNLTAYLVYGATTTTFISHWYLHWTGILQGNLFSVPLKGMNTPFLLALLNTWRAVDVGWQWTSYKSRAVGGNPCQNVLKRYLSTSRKSLNETHVPSQLDKLTSTLSARLTKQFTSTRVCGFSA